MCSKFEQKVRTLRVRRNSLPIIRRILKMLDAGYYCAKIAQMLGKHRTSIHYYIKKLEQADYISPLESFSPWQRPLQPYEPHKKVRGVIKLYRLTQAGSNFLAGIERAFGRGRVFRLHNVYFKYPIVRQPGMRIAWRRVEMTNWTQLLGRELGLRVRKNPRSIEVIANVVEGQDPYELLLLAREEADRLAGHLEQKFDMVLGRGKLSRKPHWGIYDRVAAKVSKHFQLSDDVGKIDESEGFGEIDFTDPEAAKDYLLMPLNLQRLQLDVNDMKDNLARLTDQIQTLVGELHSLVDYLRGSSLQRVERPELSDRDRFVV